MSVPYTARVAKVNLAVAANLAMAPKPPLITPEPRPGSTMRSTVPTIGRGDGYDAVLRWRPASPAEDIAGYAVVMRPTTAAYWEREIYVGKVNTYTLKDVSVDDVKFGVKAIGVNGTESLVTLYLYPSRVKTEIETVQ
jgi:hypothetical protein